MKHFAAALAVIVFASAGFAIAPPVQQPVPPAIVPTGNPVNPHVVPNNPPQPKQPLANTPEPASLTIAGVSLAAAGVYRLARRRRQTM